MTTYYVRSSGNNANAGTSAALAWATLAKALGATGISSGDTVYVGAGQYNEAVTLALTSPTAETKVIADTTGAFTGDAGDVLWTAFTSGTGSAVAASSLITMASRDYMTFENFTFVGGSATIVNFATTGSENCTFRNCVFDGSNAVTSGVAAILFNASANVAAVLRIERCSFWFCGVNSGNGVIQLQVPTSATADYNMDIAITDCFAAQSNRAFVNASSTGANSFKGGGVNIEGCTVLGNTFVTTTSGISTTIPITVKNNTYISPVQTAFSINISGQVTDSGGNRLLSSGTGSNITLGGSSKNGTAGYVGIELDIAYHTGRSPRHPATPRAVSELLGYAAATVRSADLLNLPRPAGSLAGASGALERHNTATQETSTTQAGSSGLVITGPGDQSIDIAVDAVSTTVSIYARYDTAHATTNKPQIQVANGEQCGVATATATMTSGVDSWEQLSLTFTPTAKGIVTLRLFSRSASGTGHAYFDTLAVT